MISRRAFIRAGAAALVAMPRASRAQESAKPWRIGFLEAGAPAANQHFLDAFKRGLSERGYTEGGNVVIVERWGDGQVDRFPALLNELVQEKVDIIVVSSTAGAVAAKATIKTLPVVFVGVQDPVGIGIVSSLGRPGANLTGFSQAEEEGLVGKRIELIKEAVPPVDRLGLIWNPTAPGVELRLKEARKAATRFGVTLRTFEVRDARELDGIFVTMTKERLARLMVLADPLTVRNRAHIVELAARSRIPAIYPFLEFTRVGGLMAYGPSIPELFRRAAGYVEKILKGAKPADLPVEQPTKFDLVINLKTAKALGLSIPRPVLARADELLQ
ncbi:MAG TPA: ABC transporter substrate-binding protein [Methylomirabilota bacterium]|nr:ABC transporter substrate-binding protein [Methylomirabilota bacterium]